MELFGQLVFGFEQALSPANLGFCFLGALFGTLVGVLPGLGPVATIAMLLPITFSLPPVSALIMLAGLYYGAQYGGSTTAILVNIPGESSSVVTLLDGHAMAKRGRAGAALAIAALGSFFAGTVATAIIAIFSAPMVWLASTFQSPDYFGLMVFGLIAAVVLAQGSVVRSIVMVLVGLTLGLVGTDLTTGRTRFTFGIPQLSDGISIISLAMGHFGVGEVISNLARTFGRPEVQPVTSLWPNREEMRRSIPAVLRGTVIGSLLGVLPGGGALVASFGAYVIEKKWSKYPEEFGKGAVEGVASPEAANNAGAQTSFIPLLTLGLPSNAVMALMLAAMTIHGIVPGPKLMVERPDLFWAMIASMWIGNLMLVIINLPLIRIWVLLPSIRKGREEAFREE
jgi:TctA family transporter